jgi:predicted enzyme related to lactoylglutathione lyase
MAKKSVKKKGARQGAKKRTSKAPATRSRAAAKRPAPTRAAQANRPSKIRSGIITHTELASLDPEATRVWCQKVLGWTFGEPVPTPSGPYHMWRFPNDTGGGIRANNPPEVPGSIPYCEVAGIQAVYKKALQSGANEMLSPQELPGGMGWIAIVAAPGGVPIGFWSMKA